MVSSKTGLKQYPTLYYSKYTTNSTKNSGSLCKHSYIYIFLIFGLQDWEVFFDDSEAISIVLLKVMQIFLQNVWKMNNIYIYFL